MQTRGGALPLPTFRSLQSLSHEELKIIYQKANKTKRNLSSMSPQFNKHVTMAFPEGVNILSFGFIPGGRYVLTFSDDHLAQLWDVTAVSSQDDSEGNSPPPKASLVSSHPTKVDPFTCNFQVQENPGDGPEIVVAGVTEIS